MFLENNTILEVCPEDDTTSKIPRIQYHVRVSRGLGWLAANGGEACTVMDDQQWESCQICWAL